ncbi:MAG: hypothetical protein WB662_02010 [Methyloceanibacter sp.]|jgi:hypothetical protein
MLRPLPKLTAFVILVLPVLALGGCSRSSADTRPPPNFNASLKGYDKTLTPEQQAAAIADLQKAQAKQQGAGANQNGAPP